MGENHFGALPSALYGIVLLMAAIAYYLLSSRRSSDRGDPIDFRKVIFVAAALIWSNWPEESYRSAVIPQRLAARASSCATHA
jgi:hypothetical protein